MKKLIVLVLFGMSISSQTFAAEFPGLKRFVHENIEAVKGSLKEATTASDTGEGWFFRDILIRMQPRFGVEVPWIAGFTIMPEVELVFQRQLPTGTTIYKP